MRPPERTLMNERVLRFRELYVINERGENLGNMDSMSALQQARQADLDLVVVNVNARPPVAKILDFGKYEYEQEKRTKESAKKSKATQLKAVRLRPGTDDHDVEVKLKNVIRFLGEGHKVKITVTFRSREITRPERGIKVLHHFAEAAAEIAMVEREPKLENRFMAMILSPKAGGSHPSPPKQQSEPQSE
jgi:translation initiation factor IF-3